jgi:thiol-disulfide isomerase/thioredoxin
VEAPLPADSKRSNQSRYWRNRALLALLDQHQADAIAYFQLALQVRPEPPKMYHGKLEDRLLDEAQDLWKQLGGTESAFMQWSAPPAASGAGEQQKQGRWEKPKKDLPSFELTDLSGKTWRLKSFEGKTVMINLWATWCGPCQAELPEFQKLYEKVKDRPDVQVISFNIDAELGLVAPFMKEKGYTFPAVIAYEFTRKLLDDIGIPQNWIVDQNGKWQLTQLGYGAEPDWPGAMLERLESMKVNSQPH